MKTNTIELILSEAMDRQNIKKESDAVELNVVAAENQDLFSECTYGLEYIIDELFPEGNMNMSRQTMMSSAEFGDFML